MVKQFEEVMVFEDLTVVRVWRGSKQRYRFEMPHDLKIEKRLIEHRRDIVKVLVSRAIPNADREDVTISGIFEVIDLGVKELVKGNRLFVTIETAYDKDEELKAVELRYDQVKFYMEQTQETLPGIDPKDDGEQELVDE